jgi:exopolysaccharide biosynthesis polyprenyl glycosylphosphotransferase
VAASFCAAYFIAVHFFGRAFASLAAYLWVLGASIAIWLLCLCGLGLYRSATYTARTRLLARLLQTHFIAGLLLFSTMYLTKSAEVSRLLLQIFLAVSFAALIAQKFALRAYLGRIRRRVTPSRCKVLLVAPSAIAERTVRMFRDHPSMLVDLVGIVAPNAAQATAGAAIQGPPLLGTLDDVPGLMQSLVIDDVVVAGALDEAQLERLSQWCAVRGVVIRLLVATPPAARGVWTAEHFAGAFMLSLAAVPQNPLSMLAKRSMDVAGAALGLFACACAWLWYGPRLRRETGDSVLFRQRRVGHNGRRFTLYKFRTMCARAEQLRAALIARNEMRGPIFKLSNDPRATPTGRRLRRRHLDELPQFWNVLRGEMSLVGTRPPTEDEVAAYAEHHHRRLSMKPGLTGLWQLAGNFAVSDFDEVVKLDCEYIDNWSLWLDLKIMRRTVAKVMRGDNW